MIFVRKIRFWCICIYIEKWQTVNLLANELILPSMCNNDGEVL